MSPSSPESLASSFVSLSLSQAGSAPSSTRSGGGPPPGSSGDEFVFLPTGGSVSSSSGRNTGNRASDSASSDFSLVNLPSQSEDDDDERDANEVDRSLLSSPPRQGGHAPVGTSFRSRTSTAESHDQEPSSSSDHGGSSASGRSRSGRSRQRVRARALAAEARREAAAQGRGTPSASSAAHRRNSNDSSEREDEDDVGSVLGSDFTDEDASDTIDDFLESAQVFALRGDSGKLQLYQAFCVELGLCLPPMASSYASSSFRSRSNSSASYSSNDSDRTTSRRSATPTRSITPTQVSYFPFPTSITQAVKILKENAFINLRDYFELRAAVGDGTSYDPESATSASSVDGDGSASGRARVSTAEGRVVRDKALAALRYSSRAALRRHTLKNGRFVKLNVAKSALLQPFLIDMSFHNQRQ